MTPLTRRKRAGSLIRNQYVRPVALLLMVLTTIHWVLTSLSNFHPPTIPSDPPFVLPSNDATSRFAYVFLLGGLDPNNMTPFLGYLYNILVAAFTLRSTGSQADIVLLIQPRKPSMKLLPKWTSLLESSMGIKVQYVMDHQEEQQSFFSVMLQKFKILQMTQYKRVLFLDADIVPFCNLDYLFEASMSGIIQPNFVLAGSDAPAAGNFFLLEPAAGDYETLITQIVKPTLDRGKWDGKRGWGHEIDENDPWERLAYGGSKFVRRTLPWWHEKGRHWDFHGGPADQGLLYHWVKYVKRNVTIAVGPMVETWKDNSFTDGVLVDQPVLVNRTSSHPLQLQSCRRHVPIRFHSKEGTTVPYSDYEHNKKIWERGMLPSDISNRFDASSPAQYWFHVLSILDQQFDLQINWARWMDHIGNKKRPLGTKPSLHDLESASSAAKRG